MGFLSGGSCYSSVDQAAAVFLASFPTFDGSAGKSIYVTSPVVSASGVSYVVKDETGKVLNAAASVSFVQVDCTDYPMTMGRVFGIPETADIQAAWQAGFLVPMTIAFVAWCLAKLVTFWK